MYEETEDDAVTKFYKQHMVKSKPPGQASAHKVDAYMAQATTHSFHVKQQRRKEFREKQDDIRRHEENNKGYAFLMSIAFALVVYTMTSQMIHTRQHDAELRRIKFENEKKSTES